MPRPFRVDISLAGAADQVEKWRADAELADAVAAMGGSELAVEDNDGDLQITYRIEGGAEHQVLEQADTLAGLFLPRGYSFGVTHWSADW